MIRPERSGKLIILGFLGVCPNVEVRLPNLDRATSLSFLLSGAFDEGQYGISVEVTDANRRVIAATHNSALAIEGAGGPMNVAPTFLLTFGYSGEYVLRCMVDGVECYAGAFWVKGADPVVSAK